MRRRLLSSLALAIVGACLSATSAAAGGNPGKQPLPTPPDVVTGTCGPAVGAVLAHITVNRGFTKTFVEKDGTIKATFNGATFATLTRLSTGQTLTLNISGPGWILVKPDGQVTLIAHGALLYIDPPGGGIWLYRGNATIDGATGVVTSFSGNLTDVCQLLQ